MIQLLVELGAFKMGTIFEKTCPIENIGLIQDTTKYHTAASHSMK